MAELLRDAALRGAAIVDQDGAEIVRFDAVLSMELSDEARVTENPVERRAAIADHVQQQPLGITLSGVLSNTPVADSLAVGVPVVPPMGTVRSLDFDRLSAIQQAKRLGQPVSLVMETGSWANLAIASIKVSRYPDDGQSLTVALTLKEIRFAEGRTVALPPRRRIRVVGDAIGEREDRGQGVPQKADAADEALFQKGNR